MYKQLLTRTLRLAYDSIHLSVKSSARTLTFSTIIRCSRSSNELKKQDLTLLGAPCPERQCSRQSAGYQDHRTQNGYWTAVFITRTRRTLSLTQLLGYTQAALHLANSFVQWQPLTDDIRQYIETGTLVNPQHQFVQ